MSNRLVRRFFKCHKCKETEAQLIHPNSFDIKCSKCGSYLNEIQEKEFKILKSGKKKNNEHKSNNDSPYMPSENAFRNISSVYNRPPSHMNNQRQNQNQNIRSNNQNNNNRNRFIYNQNNNTGQQQRNRRYQSTNHYSDMNIVNDNIYNNDNYNNINNNNINNYNENNEINENTEDNDFGEQEERSNQRRSRFGNGARNRGRSTDPMNISFSDNFFNNFFESPMVPFNMMMSPFMFSHNDEGPFRVYVQRQTVPEFIFDPIFLSFGSMFNDNFRNNFSSNFRSNFRGNFLNEIIRILERNEDEAARRAHPPTSESALNKLKRFPLSEKYCKKDKNGKIELPSCCICLDDIKKNEETVLLPCGHMFHWNCCLNWLKRNNTCPMCRFEIKD
jgi:hypothetical protein